MATNQKKETTVNTNTRKFPPGSYLVTRDPSTLLGPTDISKWVATIIDCPGGLGVLDLHTVNKDGAKFQWMEAPAKWTRTHPSGRGYVDHQGERYLETLAASPHITITPYVPPTPLTKEEVNKFIASNEKACYRTLSAGLRHRLRGATPTMEKFVERSLRTARPKCGYDCDTCCPVSGRAEG